MSEIEQKLNRKATRRIVLCAAMFTVLALFVAGLFTFNANYCRIYDSPEVKDASVDFDGCVITSRAVACNLNGNWEFFYNKWIVTDGYEGEADGMLKLPGVWTYKDFGSGTLPKTGYASYRLTAFNVQPDTDVVVYRHWGNFAYRVFINGELCVVSGILSKDAAETNVSGGYDRKIPYRTDGSPLEIVIELSATDWGGLNAAPWLAAVPTGTSYGTNWRSYTYTMLGLSFAALVISILSFAFFGYKRDYTVPAFMCALFIYLISSKDMLYVTSMPMMASIVISFLSSVAAFVLLVLHFRRNGVQLGKIYLTVSGSAALVFTVLLVVFYGTPLAPVFAFALFGVGCSYFVPFALRSNFSRIQFISYTVLFEFLMSVFCFELCDGLGLLVFGTEFIFSAELMLIIACFTALWLWKISESARKAMRVSALESELAKVQNHALKAQIKPHFVYNSLTAIQARYRKGLDDGDKAIEQFARHLRLVTDSDSEEMIEFETEVRNVLNYFELENLRADGKLNLLLDINYTDFCVPVLSLQPLVENAVRHGGLSANPDGYIRLASQMEDGKIRITVEDNGVGFDPNDAHEGVGLENTRKRFELTGAEMKTESEIGKGTKITITIVSEK